MGTQHQTIFFLTSKLQGQVEYILISSKNIYKPEILLIAPSKLKNVKNSKMSCFALKDSLTSGVSVASSLISIELLVIAVFLDEVVQVSFAVQNTS